MVVQMGTPSFIILIKHSEFEKLYVEKFDKIN